MSIELGKAESERDPIARCVESSTDLEIDGSVRVFQLIAENTVEDKVLDIQRKKEDLIRGVSRCCLLLSGPLYK